MLAPMKEFRYNELILSMKKYREREKTSLSKTKMNNGEVVLNIELIRRAARMSLRQLSIKSEVARGYLSELESGKHCNPSLTVMYKLKVALGRSLDDLIMHK